MIGYIYRVWDLIETIGVFTCTWPERHVSKMRYILRNIYWTFTLINTTLSVGSLILGMRYNDTGVITTIEAATEMGCISELICDLILYKKHGAKLWMMVENVKSYVAKASEYENNVIEGYIERYKKQFMAIIFQYVSAGVLFSVVAMCTSKDLPFSSWFPFSIERKEVYYYIFFVESYSIIQTAFSIFADFLIVGLVIFVASRLDVLGSEMKNVSDYNVLTDCIKQHQEIIRFFEDSSSTVRVLLFKTNITMGGTVISAVLCLLYAKDESFVKACLYSSTMLAACGHIFIITWPADDLRESSLKFAKSLLDIPWTGRSPKISKAVLIMMSRCQKPFLITMGGILPVLSLQFFSQFLTNVFSYFMAMRSALE